MENFNAYEGELQVREEWRIFDDGAADWALCRVRDARAERDRMKDHFNRQIAKANEVCARTEEYFSAKLMEYFATLPVRETKTQKTYDLPSGKLVLKAQGPKYERDEKALCAWLEANGHVDMIKVTKEAKWADLKPLTRIDGEELVFTETGEIIPGAKATPRPDEFRMEV